MITAAQLAARLAELAEQRQRIEQQLAALLEHRSTAELEIAECDKLLALGYQNQLAITAGMQEIEQLLEQVAP